MFCPDENEIWPFKVDRMHPNGKFAMIEMKREAGGEIIISCDLDQLRQLYEEIGSTLQAAEQSGWTQFDWNTALRDPNHSLNDPERYGLEL